MHILSFLVIFRYIQAKSDGIRHIQELFRQVQAYSEPRYIQNPGIFTLRDIFRNPVHLETLHMQNFSIFKTLVHSETEAYSEPGHIKNPRDVQNQRYFQNPGIFRTLAYSEPETYWEKNWESPNYFLFFLVPFLFSCPLGYLYIEKL